MLEINSNVRMQHESLSNLL